MILGGRLKSHRVCRTTVQGERQKRVWLGMAVGIAMKPGNAGGVKTATAFNRERANIDYTQR